MSDTVPPDDPQSEGAATLAVTPDTVLIDHQVVDLSGSGYRADYPFVVEQCPANAPAGSCDSNRETFIASDDAGRLRNPYVSGTTSAPIGVSAVIHPITSNHSTDCRVAPGICELRVLSFTDRQVAVATAPVGFDPLTPLDAPGALTIGPDTDLTDGQVVMLTANHQRPYALLFAFLCKAGGAVPDPGEFPLHECANFITAARDSLVDETGVMTSQFRVRATFEAASGETVDCRATGCEIAVTEQPLIDEPITLPLPLDPDAPLAPAPVITADPASDLADGDRVQVEGSDWFPGELVWVAQCLHTSRARFGHCLDPNLDLVQADAEGQFDIPLVIAAAGRTFSDGPIDCRLDGCDLAAFRAETNDNESAVVPISLAEVPPIEQPPPGAEPLPVEPHFTG